MTEGWDSIEIVALPTAAIVGATRRIPRSGLVQGQLWNAFHNGPSAIGTPIWAGELAPALNTPIVVYCASGEHCTSLVLFRCCETWGIWTSVHW